MHTLLLQAADAASPLLNGLLDKGLTLGVLGVISYNLWQRQKQQDEKLDKYINEDRSEMLEAIKNNTAALQSTTELLREMAEKHNDR